MRVDLVDPPAYSLPYDGALARALALCGAEVRLLTSEFAYANAPAVLGYAREEFFYRHAVGAPGSRVRKLAKLAEHVPDMLRYRRAAQREADVTHFQWLTVPRLDLRLLPDRPTVLTIHDPLERGGRRRPIAAGAFARVDAVVVHSEYARARVLAQHGLDPERVHVIRMGAFGREGVLGAVSPRVGPDRPELPPELHDDGSPVVLCFGLIRPYKGIATLLAAWRGITGAQLWIVGRPMIDLGALTAAAPPGAQIVPRFVTEAEESALFARADLVVLPYERSERFGFSAVLATALGHGRAIVLSDVGGLAEVADTGAVELVPPSDPQALHAALAALLADGGARDRLAAAAATAAATTYSWETAARATLALYDRIRGA